MIRLKFKFVFIFTLFIISARVDLTILLTTGIRLILRVDRNYLVYIQLNK